MPPKSLKKKTAPSDGSATPHIPTLAEQLSYLHLPKPFKNPQYTKNINRRVKNLKTVLGQEREREKADRERRRQVQLDAEAHPPEGTMDVDGETNKAKTVTVEEDKEAPTYTSIEAPPSIWPQKRYCDITGLEAPYTDPATGLRYHDKSVYEVVKNLSASTAKEYLSGNAKDQETSEPDASSLQDPFGTPTGRLGGSEESTTRRPRDSLNPAVTCVTSLARLFPGALHLDLDMQTARNLTRQCFRKQGLILGRGIKSSAPCRPSLSSPTPRCPHISSRSCLTHRQFSRSSALFSTGSVADPSRPDLFYHILQPPTPLSKSHPIYALSFSMEKPPSHLSRTIIGWLPAQGRKEGTDSNSTSVLEATLEDFVENPDFIEILHSAVRDGLREGVDEIQKTIAVQKMDGWMHIHDERNIPALNRIGDPDDIIGTVLVKNCEIQAETYQPMPSYRLVTADGLTQLTPGLAQKLRDTLNRIADAERAELR